MRNRVSVLLVLFLLAIGGASVVTLVDVPHQTVAQDTTDRPLMTLEGRSWCRSDCDVDDFHVKDGGLYFREANTGVTFFVPEGIGGWYWDGDVKPIPSKQYFEAKEAFFVRGK